VIQRSFMRHYPHQNIFQLESFLWGVSLLFDMITSSLTPRWTLLTTLVSYLVIGIVYVTLFFPKFLLVYTPSFRCKPSSLCDNIFPHINTNIVNNLGIIPHGPIFAMDFIFTMFIIRNYFTTMAHPYDGISFCINIILPYLFYNNIIHLWHVCVLGVLWIILVNICEKTLVHEILFTPKSFLIQKLILWWKSLNWYNIP